MSVSNASSDMFFFGPQETSKTLGLLWSYNGACVYLRTIDSNNIVHVHLLTSKTRVAPLKTQTIPRLELCAAVLLARLYSKVISSLTLKIDNTYMWCDSQVALAWIRTSPHLFQVFVGNRDAEIQKLVQPELWNYVPSQKNPADMHSRGITPKNSLVAQDRWFHGQEWLLVTIVFALAN